MPRKKQNSMSPNSNNLFHFTKSLDFLKGILAHGFLPRYCLEDVSFLDIEYMGYPMTCFCDIPISRLSEHTAFYGEYGIGLTKEWGLKNQLAPLIYTPPESAITELARYLLKLDLNNEDGSPTPAQHDLNEHFFRILPMIKPISGKMVVAGTIVEKDFYQENEWRYVPKDSDVLFREKFDDEREAMNKAVEGEKLSFMPSDVKYIFLKSDAEIPIIFDFIQNNLGHFPLNEIKILSTRIVSLETISRDL